MKKFRYFFNLSFFMKFNYLKYKNLMTNINTQMKERFEKPNPHILYFYIT